MLFKLWSKWLSLASSLTWWCWLSNQIINSFFFLFIVFLLTFRNLLIRNIIAWCNSCLRYFSFERWRKIHFNALWRLRISFSVSLTYFDFQISKTILFLYSFLLLNAILLLFFLFFFLYFFHFSHLNEFFWRVTKPT